MVKIITLFSITAILLVGYWAYIDSNKRKEQNMLQLIQEANKTILTVGNNPHNNMALTK